VSKNALALLKRALTLSPKDRAALAGSLIDSLEPAADPTVESAWNQEILRRIEELESGKSRTVPWEEVRRRISARLTNGR